MRELTKNKKINLILSEIKQISKLLYERGWADSSSGNFSINITKLIKSINIRFSQNNTYRANRIYKYLCKNYILVTNAGSKMRDIIKNPFDNICILYFNNKGDKYCVYTLGKNKILPTSELQTHLEILNLQSKKNIEENVVLHTHPAEMIALTHIRKYCNEKNINKLMFSIQPEVTFLFPNGIGFIPYLKTGSEKLALETVKKFDKYKIVLWEKHGCITIGKNLYDAFDKIDVLVKSLKIFFMCHSTGNKPEGLSVYQIKDLRK